MSWNPLGSHAGFSYNPAATSPRPRGIQDEVPREVVGPQDVPRDAAGCQSHGTLSGILCNVMGWETALKHVNVGLWIYVRVCFYF